MFHNKIHLLRFFDKNPRFRCILSFLFVLSIFSPSIAEAHAYSASFTTIKMTNQNTEFVFSIDALSLIELIDSIDKNKDKKLEKSEIEKGSHQLEELVHDHITLDRNNREQEPKLEKLKIVKKDQKDFLSFYYTFPAFSPGDTISFNDGFYVNDSATNYVNFISFDYEGSTGQSVLQGSERTWTILLSEPQEEQQSDGAEQQQSGQSGQADQGQVQPESGKTVEKSVSTSWFSFFKLGMLHILTGYDHLLFLFALLLRKQTFKQYVAIVTSFTLAHSITLSLAVLGFVTLPSRFVEAVIAFSICYVAIENIIRKDIKRRWGITFLFGLIHGLGFASILKEMNIPNSSLAAALVNFNIGIEVVQLGIVLLLLPLLTYLFKLKASEKIILYGSIVIFALGAVWLVERIFF